MAAAGAVELTVHVAVLIGAAAWLCVRGLEFSHQFQAGQQWEHYAPGLAPGLFGRRVVSRQL